MFTGHLSTVLLLTCRFRGQLGRYHLFSRSCEIHGLSTWYAFLSVPLSRRPYEIHATVFQCGTPYHERPRSNPPPPPPGPCMCTAVLQWAFCYSQSDAPDVLDHLREKKIDLVINLPTHASKRLEDNYAVRRTAVDFGIPLLTNLNLVKLFTSALTSNKKQKLVGLDPDSLFDYYAREKPEEAW